jgi:D-aminoacyl-tRNA deacylase
VTKIAISLKDQVGLTIKRLGYAFEELDDDVIDFTYNGSEPLVIICRHESSSGKPSLTVHYPGNPSNSTMGGRPRTLGISFPSLATSIYRQILKIDVSIDKVFEATHHGPTLETPIIFAELGSSQELWSNESLVKKLVDAVMRGIDSPTQCKDNFIGFGGPHYAYTFSSMTTESCLGHIVSKHYVKSLDESVIRQTVLNSKEKIHKVVFNDVNKNTLARIKSSLSDLDLLFESV